MRLDSLIDVAFYLESSNPDKAFTLAKLIELKSSTQNNQAALASAYMRLGSIHNLRGNIDSSLFYLRRCFKIRKQLKNYAGAIGACYILKSGYLKAGYIDSAYYILYKGLRLAEKYGSKTELGTLTLELGTLSLAYNEIDTAFYYLNAAEKMGLDLQDSILLWQVNFAFGNHYYKENNPQKALEYYLKGEKTTKRSNNLLASAVSFNNIAACYDQLENLEKAKQYYREAIAIYSDLNLALDKAETMNSLGALFYRNNALDSALFWYEEAYPLISASKNYKILTQNLRYQSLAYENKGEKEKALRLYKEYVYYKDSVLDEEKISSIAEMQTKYDTEKKEQQILLLDEQNKTKAAQRNVFIAGTIVLFLGLFILGFYYRQRVKLNKKDKQIAEERISTMLKKQEAKSYTAMLQGQEEERQRIASDLHDRLGGMLSTTKLLLAASDSKSENASTQVQKATELIDEAVKEVRRVSHNLSTGMVQSFGLLGALEDLASSINQSKIIRCTVNAYGLDERLETALEIDVYRMVQEAVNNVLKHARASRLDIQLNYLEDGLSISIEDNGLGFNPKALGKRSGIGLRNLEVRAGKYGGDCVIDSHIGKGTMVIIDIPLKETEL